MIERDIAPLLRRLATQYPVVTLTGPRQSGKTTLVRSVFPHLAYYSMEDPDLRRFAAEDPRGFIASLGTAGAVVDEIQRASRPARAPAAAAAQKGAAHHGGECVEQVVLARSCTAAGSARRTAPAT